jgi:uncharacterized delta-60 repeat protein
MKYLPNLFEYNSIFIQENLLHILLESLNKFALQDNFLSQMELVFGSGNYSDWQKIWQQKKVNLPEIEIRSSAEINGARGGYSTDTNKIYLSKELLTDFDSAAIVKVLLEEYGHFIDAKDGRDAPGDEGELFAAIVLGETLSSEQIKRIKQESDRAVITLDGRKISIEQAAGYLDRNFDGDGKVTTDFGGYDGASSVAIQADGKIVVAGSTSSNYFFNNDDFALARYNSNGALDTTFDGDGRVTTDFGNKDRASSLAIQADGKIVVAGESSIYNPNGNISDFALARYNSNGTLDTTFGTGGKITTDFATNSSDYASSLAIQADSKIVVAGYSILARYNSDGTLDSTFDGDGRLTSVIGGISDVAIQADGKIVVAGYDNGDFALARYNSDGTLDSTFDGDGKLTTDFGGYDSASSVAIQADGKIVAAGSNGVPSWTNFRENFALARYNSDGTLDSTFDGDGKLTTDFGGYDRASSVAIQADGKIVAAGSNGVPNGISSFIDNFALARYNSDGTLDFTFFGNGKVTTDFFEGLNERLSLPPLSIDSAYSVAIQADGGKIVAAGLSRVPGSLNSDFAVAVYQGNDFNIPPTKGPDFNGDGRTDILWCNSATGKNSVWLMNGIGLSSGVYLNSVDVPTWQMIDSGDFNSDGKSDILWRNSSSGENAVWLMNGTNFSSGVLLTSVSDLNWQMIGNGDFNADNQTDILWRNTATGENSVWLMNGTNISSGVFLTSVADLNWKMIGSSDLNNDSRSDVLWRNTATGENSVWLMNGTNISSGVFLTSVPDLNWQMVA